MFVENRPGITVLLTPKSAKRSKSSQLAESAKACHLKNAALLAGSQVGGGRKGKEGGGGGRKEGERGSLQN